MASVFDRMMLLSETAATIYDSDGLSNPVNTHVIMSNYRSIGTRRTANDLGRGRFLPGTVIQPGQLVQHVKFGWFLFEKTLTSDPMTLRDTWIEAQLLPLPYLVSFLRPSLTPDQMAGATPTETDIWGAPVNVPQDAEHIPTLATQTAPVRMGVSNDFDVSHSTAFGNMPFGSLTGYTPLGSDVRQRDQVEINNQWFEVSDDSLEASFGVWYMRQFILKRIAGPSWNPA